MQLKDTLSAPRRSSWVICQCNGSFWLMRIQTPSLQSSKGKTYVHVRTRQRCSAVSSITSDSRLCTCCLTYREQDSNIAPEAGTGLQSTHTCGPGAAAAWEPASSGWESQYFSQTVALTPVAEVHVSCCPGAPGEAEVERILEVLPAHAGALPSSLRSASSLLLHQQGAAVFCLLFCLPNLTTGAAGVQVCFCSFL